MAGMEKELDREVPLDRKLDDLYEIIGDIEIAKGMITGQQPDVQDIRKVSGSELR